MFQHQKHLLLHARPSRLVSPVHGGVSFYVHLNENPSNLKQFDELRWI